MSAPQSMVVYPPTIGRSAFPERTTLGEVAFPLAVGFLILTFVFFVVDISVKPSSAEEGKPSTTSIYLYISFISLLLAIVFFVISSSAESTFKADRMRWISSLSPEEQKAWLDYHSKEEATDAISGTLKSGLFYLWATR